MPAPANEAFARLRDGPSNALSFTFVVVILVRTTSE